MGNKWRKILSILGIRVCAIAPPDPVDASHRQSTETSPCLTEPGVNGNPEVVGTRSAPSTPNRSAPSAVNMGRHSLRLSRSTCSICLETMKPGHGHALFTAECSHTFHFSCIASNVRHGNLVCPVCRAKWREVPWQAPVVGSKEERRRSGSHSRRSSSALRRSSAQASRPDTSHTAEEEQRQLDPLLYILDENLSGTQWQPNHPEPNLYNDDESLMHLNRGQSNFQGNNKEGPSHLTDHFNTGGMNMDFLGGRGTRGTSNRELNMKSFPEVSAVPACESRDSFTVLVHLKASPTSTHGDVRREMDANANTHFLDPSNRAPLDLVTVLDISGSMAGTKLALLKRAMGFVIHNLSPNDRLSVVVFASTARRIFPLRRMVNEGRQQSLQAIDALISTGGTNIAEGLRKGAKVLEDRREQNAVSAIMLLSDGQDTYTMSSRRQLPFLSRGFTDSRRLVPGSIRHSARHGQMQIPVHTFGFGADHDSSTMHTIAEVSGGTFSFIQTEGVVQDAFAQCIGGLLSVVTQDVQLMVSCSAPGVLINSIHSGSYDSSILDNARRGIIKLGDLYAEEERDILVDISIPSFQTQTGTSMSLLQASCMYKDPVSLEIKQSISNELCIARPMIIEEGQGVLSLEVDRQRNRLRIAEAIAVARSLADQGNISAAQCNLQKAKTALENSPSALAGDHLCTILEAELSEIQIRMANRQLYERSGRAYLLSAQSSHLRQRATTRGESLDSDYQTPSMVDMILQSQTLRTSELACPGAFPSGVTSSGEGSSTDVLSCPSNGSFVRRSSTKV